jgi:acyl carrier protein
MNQTPRMNAVEVRAALLELLVRIAPDIDPAAVVPDVDYRDQFDFDSMDLFHLALAVHERFGVDVPERDYRELQSLAGGTAYLLRGAT